MRKEDCKFATITIILQRLTYRGVVRLTLFRELYLKGASLNKTFLYMRFSRPPMELQRSNKQNKTGQNKANQPTNQTTNQTIKQPNYQQITKPPENSKTQHPTNRQNKFNFSQTKTNQTKPNPNKTSSSVQNKADGPKKSSDPSFFAHLMF